ncbi:DUF3560 domain-containing protein [Streptomyces scabiei]|uniref:DUF3560 domain-containing protein n=1 Tax=Streptomyces scabiei TaxID=1930 RepID=UPI0029AACF7C|nr:DUF3560 domain-containing protein [Streptomyces scabiei]MDX2540150.1 DUF3560 domain-containing protein [Streptomyces scabiei]MDX2802567.1 DUF3560 domain-containing protein [Streptomyces scabiei]MDX2861232.1 DUF3560 domain-containing protein [Streptomyces scabiei]MDX3830580.1 DUF3560 domain-containing protein [Streptomyces scabiei]
MTIEITHTRREGTLIEGTSRGDGSAEILRLREYGRTQRQLFRWSRNLDCWYLPHSRDHATYTPSLELLAQRLRDAGFEVTLTIDNADRRPFAEAEKEREEKAEGRAERFGGYAASAARNSEAAWKSSHEISERFAGGQPILVGHHSEGRARRDHARMDDTMRKSIGERDRADHWTGRAQAAANYERFKKDPGRTLRRLDKLRADLRAVEKWQRGESAKGYSRNPDDPELTIRHEELTEEIEHWEQIIKDAEAEGVKVWSKADFTRGDFVLYRGTWYEVLRVNPKSVTIPHIHNGTGKRIVRATGNRHDDWTWTAPYDDVSGRKSADEMEQPPQAEAAEHQEQAEQSPPIEEPVPAVETCPMCHSSQWQAEVRRCAHCHHAPEGKPTPASAPAAEAERQEGMALVLIASKNSRHSRKRALWAMTRREAQAVCGDPRTSGRSYMLTWTERPGTEGADWEWVPDNGSLDPVLEDLGITPRREWTAAPQAPAEAA